MAMRRLLPRSVARAPMVASWAGRRLPPITQHTAARSWGAILSPPRLARPTVSLAPHIGAVNVRSFVTGPGGSEPIVAPSSSASAAPVERQLHALDAKVEALSARTYASLQQATAELLRVRAVLETAEKRQMADIVDLKKLAASQYLTLVLFLLYLFATVTWQLMLLTDLSGHLHGIPVVRMIHAKVADPHAAPLIEPSDMNHDHGGHHTSMD